MSSPHTTYDDAIQLKNNGDLEAAIAKLKENVEAHPDHVDSHSALAVYLQKLGQFDAAIEHAKRVCELSPQDSFSFTQLSVIYVKCGKIMEAEDAKAKAHAVQHGMT